MDRKKTKFVILILILLLIALYNWRYFVVDYTELIEKNSKEFFVPVALSTAVIKVESNFDTQAIGGSGEYGLMQIMPGVVKDWNRIHKDNVQHVELFKPEINLKIGIWYLSLGLKKWCKYKYKEALALAQYNAGPGTVRRWVPKSKKSEFIKNITYPSTRNYIKKVLFYRNFYKKLGGIYE